MSKGFTLLELILAVVIIGILAALALPQYNRIIENARSAEGIAILDGMRIAEMSYYNEHGSYTSLLSDLDLDLPTAQYFMNPAVVLSCCPLPYIPSAVIIRKGSGGGPTAYRLFRPLDIGGPTGCVNGGDPQIRCPWTLK